MEKFAGTTTDITIKIHHTWGCPVYVLDVILKGNISGLPKWKTRSQAGIYLGRSPCHKGSVAMVLNPETCCVSPPIHVVFYDEFSTVPFIREGKIPPHWKDIMQRRS